MKYSEEFEICKKVFNEDSRKVPYTRRELISKLLEQHNKLNSIHEPFNEAELKEHLQKISKADVIELYLQKRYDQEMFKSEILTNIYNQIMDITYFQLNIFDKWDMIIPQDKFRLVFNKGENDEDSDNT